MKMTRPDLIVVSICGSETGCLSQRLSVSASICLAPVLAPCFVSVGRDPLAAVGHYGH